MAQLKPRTDSEAAAREFIGGGNVTVTAPRAAALRPAPAFERLFPDTDPRAVLAGLAVRELGYTATAAAAALGISRRTLGRLLTAYDRDRRRVNLPQPPRRRP